MADIGDIWDLPAEPAARASASTSEPLFQRDSDTEESGPSKSKRPLFLPSDDEDEQPRPAASGSGSGQGAAKKVASSGNAEVDALFEDLDDFRDLAPSFDIEKYRREADARHLKAAREKFALPSQTQTQTGAAVGGMRSRGDAMDLDGEGEGEGDEAAKEGEKKKKKPRATLDEMRLRGEQGFPQLVRDTKGFKPLGKGYEVGLHSIDRYACSNASCVVDEGSGSYNRDIQVLGTSNVAQRPFRRHGAAR
jgi:replication fork protection complex subunit Csm3/Swi3